MTLRLLIRRGRTDGTPREKVASVNHGNPHGKKLYPPNLSALQCSRAPLSLNPLVCRLLRLMEHVKNANMFKVVFLIFAMIVISHWLACIW